MFRLLVFAVLISTAASAATAVPIPPRHPYDVQADAFYSVFTEHYDPALDGPKEGCVIMYTYDRVMGEGAWNRDHEAFIQRWLGTGRAPVICD